MFKIPLQIFNNVEVGDQWGSFQKLQLALLGDLQGVILPNSYGFFGQMAQFSIYLSLKEVFYIQTLLYIVHTRTFMMRLHVEAVSAADKRSSFKRGHTSHRLCLFLFSH